MPANHIVNEIKVPYAGEIYCIKVNEESHEIALGTFSGLLFGKLEIGPQGRPYLVWQPSKTYFKDKLISHLCQIRPGFFLVAEYSKTGYWLVDRNEPDLDPGIVEDLRQDHNSGCTNLELVPMYDPKWFPYAISRTKFKVDIIDMVDKRVFTLLAESNTSGMTPKMVIQTKKMEGGNALCVNFNTQIADRKAVKCLTIDP